MSDGRFVEQDGFLQITVFSQGEGPEILAQKLLRSQQGDKAVSAVLGENAFVPTRGVIYTLGMLLGSHFPDDAGRITKNVRHEGLMTRGWSEPCLEAGALALCGIHRQEIERLGLWEIVPMHKTFPDERGFSYFLKLLSSGQVCTSPDIPTGGWYPKTGFLFLIR